MTVTTLHNARTLCVMPVRTETGASRELTGSIGTMHRMVEAAFVCASRHAPDRRFILVKADNLEFRRNTSAARATASVVFTGRSSLTVVVELADEERAHCDVSGRFMLMAVDHDGTPIQISQNQTLEEIRQ